MGSAVEIEISSDKTKLDTDFIYQYLAKSSYWAKGRSLETTIESIKNSFCIAAYQNQVQIAFARVVTDYCTHAYIMDFFTTDQLRNSGIGSRLLTSLLAAPELKHVNRFTLSTIEASRFYEKVGFFKITKNTLAWER